MNAPHHVLVPDTDEIYFSYTFYDENDIIVSNYEEVLYDIYKVVSGKRKS